MDREASPVCMCVLCICVVFVKDDDAVGWRVKIQSENNVGEREREARRRYVVGGGGKEAVQNGRRNKRWWL